jgi:hypothetical protein
MPGPPTMSLQQQKDELFRLLQTAMELELSTIPPYFTALVSIHPYANRVSANLIRSVMMEEMLHMTLVGNLVSSLGGTVRMGPDNVPSYPLRLNFEGKTFKDRAFDVNLEAFSPAAIDTFLQIELPTELATRQKATAAFPEIDISGITIGAFYDDIIARLKKMCDEFGEPAVFCGDPSLQVNPQFYWGSGGSPVIITSFATAKEAMEEIIEQGEGGGASIYDPDEHYADTQYDLAHYFRFNEIALGRRYQPGDTPDGPPTGEPLEVDYEAVYPIKRNPKSADYAAGSRLAQLNDEFNRKYTVMLSQIAEAFNGTPHALYDAIINGMHALTPIAGEMMALPIDGDPGGAHGAPSFEWQDPLSGSEAGSQSEALAQPA